MDQALLMSIISACVPALASIIVVFIQTNKTTVLLEERDRQMKEELVKLSNKVETHNNFGLQLAKLETRVDILERKN
jgi:hypothetical protein